MVEWPLLDQRVAIVAGGGRGIGEMISRTLAHAGATVVVVDIDESRATALATDLAQSGMKAVPAVSDVRNPTDVARLVARTHEEFGAIDILVNNAGGAMAYVERHPLAQWSEEDWDQIVNRNLRYVFLTCRETIPHMVEAKRGAIVNIASIAGLVSAPQASAYGAAKAGVINLTSSLAVEYGPAGVRVNAVAPGPIATPAASQVVSPENLAQIPLGRLGAAQDIANAVLFLASDLSSFVTGETLLVDGGVEKRDIFQAWPWSKGRN